ncbi:MAG: hypothetical protein WA004_03310 [Saprospiraceae bacterium]
MDVLFLTAVTDLELMAGQVVKGVLVLLLLSGAVFNLLKAASRRTGLGKRVVRSVMALLLFLPIFFLVKWIFIEDQLLREPVYTTGTTLGPCSAAGRGKGLEFEYQVNGVTYRNCNTYHPIPLQDIAATGGRYRVRYTARFPGSGRINFNEKQE